MKNIEHLTTSIKDKKEKVGLEVAFIDPSSEIDSITQAKWMIGLLEQTYHRHGISQHSSVVQSQIESGKLRNWFALKDGLPIAVASLISQSDGSVEVGRAVASDRGRGIGGILMLQAALHHFSESEQPLVAEVRISDQFEGIPSGLATQKISLGHIGLFPQAVVPAFHHGEPDRQEQFVFSSSEIIQPLESTFVPDEIKSQTLITKAALSLAESAIKQKGVIFQAPERIHSGWTIQFTEPFALITRDTSQSQLSQTISKAEQSSPFSLLPIEMSPIMAGPIIEAMNHGFIPCGIAREIGGLGHPVLLLGKLRTGTILAPIKLMPEVFSGQQRQAIQVIDTQFRKLK